MLNNLFNVHVHVQSLRPRFAISFFVNLIFCCILMCIFAVLSGFFLILQRKTTVFFIRISYFKGQIFAYFRSFIFILCQSYFTFSDICSFRFGDVICIEGLLIFLLQIFKLGFRDATVCYGLYLGIRQSIPDTFLTF